MTRSTWSTCISQGRQPYRLLRKDLIICLGSNSSQWSHSRTSKWSQRLASTTIKIRNLKSLWLRSGRAGRTWVCTRRWATRTCPRIPSDSRFLSRPRRLISRSSLVTIGRSCRPIILWIRHPTGKHPWSRRSKWKLSSEKILIRISRLAEGREETLRPSSAWLTQSTENLIRTSNSSPGPRART